MKTETLKVIESEQAYAESKWPGRQHAVGEHLLIIEELVLLARTNWVTKSGDEPCLDIMRKIAATVVTCMDEHGAVQRK